VVLGLVCWAVRKTAQSALGELSDFDWNISPGWFALAGLAYVVGLLPMAWYWRRVLLALDQHVAWLSLATAYYVGHLGKYVPGKALVVVLRTAMIQNDRVSVRAAVVSVFLETLTMMAVGAFLAGALAIAILEVRGVLVVLAVVMMLAAGIPTLPPIARRLARLVLRERQLTSEVNLDGLNWRLFGYGWAAGVMCWTALGVSLWATLRAMGITSLSAISDLPLLVASVSMATVAGFLSLLPGGLVVRDALLMESLATRISEGDALIAAVLLRLVWLVSEIAICVILYLVAIAAKKHPPSLAPPQNEEGN
jgi:hypothetical protein